MGTEARSRSGAMVKTTPPATTTANAGLRAAVRKYARSAPRPAAPPKSKSAKRKGRVMPEHVKKRWMAKQARSGHGGTIAKRWAESSTRRRKTERRADSVIHDFVCCYMLRSRQAGHATYIGKTAGDTSYAVWERCAQHNGGVKSGGAATTDAMRPLDLMAYVTGFDTQRQALSFEAVWTFPANWARTRKVWNGMRSARGEEGIAKHERRLRFAMYMLSEGGRYENKWFSPALKLVCVDERSKRVVDDLTAQGKKW